MQLMLILGVGFAIGAVGFALQNNIPVTVTFAIWSLQSSLAMVLLIALGLGALVAGLVSSPSMIRSQWARRRLQRQLDRTGEESTMLKQRIQALETQLQGRGEPLPAPEPTSSVVGLGTILSDQSKSIDEKG